MRQFWIYPEKLTWNCYLIPYETQTRIVGIRGVSPANREGVVFNLPESLHNGWGHTLEIFENNTPIVEQSGILAWGELVPTVAKDQAVFWADDFRATRPFPLNPPTREVVLTPVISYFGGLIVNSPVYGRMPWWDPCIAWCDYNTRKEAYKKKHENGETHVMFHIPSGTPLYPDPNPRNFYNPRRFPALDWTNGLSHLDDRFGDLINEIINEGFLFILNMDERMEQSTEIVQLVMEYFRDEMPHAIEYGFTMPGYDGVYAQNNQWPDASVTVAQWASLARAIMPDCYLGIMHGPHYIPFGNTGPDGYLPGGAMDGFDWVCGEFPSCDPRPTYDPEAPLDRNADSIWQVLGRMIRPYNRPPEQPDFDDPDPPFYLVDSPRGKRYYSCLEIMDGPFEWVRTDPYNDEWVRRMQDHYNRQRAYFKELGSKYTG